MIFRFLLYSLIGISCGLLTSCAHGEAIKETPAKEKLWPVTLRGMDIWVTRSGQYTEDDIANFANNWKGNCLRIQILNFIESKPPYSIRDESFKELDRLLDLCEKYKIKAIIDVQEIPGKTGTDHRVWSDFAFHKLLIDLWETIAQRYSSRGDVIAGYDILNEPDPKDLSRPEADWSKFTKEITQAVRKYDKKHIIIIEPIIWGHAEGFRYLEPTGDTRTVYSFHYYDPFELTHQGAVKTQVNGSVSYPGLIAGISWDKKTVEKSMSEAFKFEAKYGVEIFCGEFGCVRWAPGSSAYDYLKDVIELLEEHGYNWTYHCYRSYDGWNAEMGNDKNDRTVKETDRLLLMKKYFQKNIFTMP